MKELTKAEAGRTILPACSVTEEKETVVLRVELPGVHKEDIEVRVDQDQLTITGRVPQATQEGTWLLRERRTGDYSRRFTLDDSVDRERIDAHYENGVMRLTLHLKDEVKPRRIEIAG